MASATDSSHAGPESPPATVKFTQHEAPRSSPPATVDSAKHEAPNSPLFFGSNEGQSDSPSPEDLPDYHNLNQAPPIDPSTVSLNNDRRVDGLLDEVASSVEAGEPAGAFGTAYERAFRGYQVHVNPASRDQLLQRHHQRGSANSDEEDDADDGDDEDVVDRDELERVLLPIVVDLAAAATKKISSRYHKIVKDQVYHEYQIYAKSNRTDFIHRLAQEAWPEAAQQAKDSCRIYEQNIKAEANRRIARWEAESRNRIAIYEESDMKRFDRRLKTLRARKMDELDQALEDKESELLEKAEKYRNQLKAECEMDIANEKQNRRTIMRAQVDREMRQEKEARYAAMEAELRRARAKAWTQMKFEVEEGRSNMAAKMTGKAASESGADGDSENEDDRASENGADKASENGDDGASESGADDGSVNAPTEASENGDDRASVQDGRNTPTESSDDAKSDTSLINESAKSPVSRSRTSRSQAPSRSVSNSSRGRKRSRSVSTNGSESEGEEKRVGGPKSDDEPTETTIEDDRPAKRSCLDRMFNIGSAPSTSPTTTNPPYEDTHDKKPGAFFKPSGLNPKMPVPAAAVPQNAMPGTGSGQQQSNSSAPHPPPQNTQETAESKKEKNALGKIEKEKKYSFGQTNDLKDAEL